jgi:hypothetical protein
MLAALIAALRTATVPAVHRLLGRAGWIAVARIVAGAHAAGPILTAATAGPTDAIALERGIARRAASIVDSSEVAAALRRSRLRPDDAVAVAWAVLAIADADPGALTSPDAPSLVRRVAAQFAPNAAGLTGSDDHGPAEVVVARPTADAGRALAEADPTDVVLTRAEQGAPTPIPADGAPTDHAPIQAGPAETGVEPTDPRPRHTGRTPATIDPAPAGVEADPTATPAAPAPPDPTTERPHAAVGAPTAWAGLLFLLATADQAGVPAQVLADAELRARPLAWVLHAIARQIVPAAPDDPAVLAFAGLRPSDEPPPSDVDTHDAGRGARRGPRPALGHGDGSAAGPAPDRRTP